MCGVWKCRCNVLELPAEAKKGSAGKMQLDAKSKEIEGCRIEVEAGCTGKTARRRQAGEDG
jgi:hypothetical protein